MARIRVFQGIRGKLMAYYLLVTVLMGSMALFTHFGAKAVTRRYESLFGSFMDLNAMNAEVASLDEGLRTYLSSQSSEALLGYYDSVGRLERRSEGLTAVRGGTTEALLAKDIGHMIRALLSETEKAVNAKRGRIGNRYLDHYTRSRTIVGYIRGYNDRLLYGHLGAGSLEYGRITGRIAAMNRISSVLIACTVAMSVLLAVTSTYRITQPLLALTRSASRVGRGGFDEPPVEVGTGDEVQVLAEAFNGMVGDLRDYVDRLRDQAEMEGLLKEAELKALQSRINPHFLFNTLNVASQLAMLEGADRTSEFVQKTADLLRYGLRGLDRPVPLADEVANAIDYMYVLKMRFADRVSFVTDIDGDLGDVSVPGTIIQPMVENAFIHGIEGLDRPGTITLRTMRQGDFCVMEVSDDGAGIDAAGVEAIMAGEAQGHGGHLSGIGMKNVMDRLRIFAGAKGYDDVVSIDSAPGKGTIITMRVPMGGGSVV